MYLFLGINFQTGFPSPNPAGWLNSLQGKGGGLATCNSRTVLWMLVKAWGTSWAVCRAHSDVVKDTRRTDKLRVETVTSYHHGGAARSGGLSCIPETVSSRGTLPGLEGWVVCLRQLAAGGGTTRSPLSLTSPLDCFTWFLDWVVHQHIIFPLWTLPLPHRHYIKTQGNARTKQYKEDETNILTEWIRQVPDTNAWKCYGHTFTKVSVVRTTIRWPISGRESNWWADCGRLYYATYRP